MWKHSETITINTKPSIIWDVWKDVPNWNQWDSDIEWSSLNGNFEIGSKGQLKPANGPKATFTITEIIPNKRFVDTSTLPLTKLTFIHDLEETNSGVTITHTIQMDGLLSGLFSKIIGKSLAKGLPNALQNLKQLVENKS